MMDEIKKQKKREIMHTGKKAYYCGICDDKFTTKEMLEVHIACHCDHSNDVFCDRASLKEHKRLYH